MFRDFIYTIVKGLCWGVLKVHNRVEIRGRELIPSDRPVIVAANHVSNLDPVVVGVAFPTRLRPMGKEALLHVNRFFTWLISTLGMIPVSRESGREAARALKTFLEVIRGGESLMIFPEGARSLDGKLMELEGGAAVLAVSENAPIVPLYIDGTFKAMPVGAKKIGWNKITATFGKPVYPLPVEEQKSRKEERERVRLALQNELLRLERKCRK